MSESQTFQAEEETGKTYRTAGVMRAAQHRFLILGILLVIAIGGVLALLNESVKEETKFQQALENQATAILPIPPVPASGLSYEALPEPLIPTTDESGGPTIPAAPAELPSPPAAP